MLITSGPALAWALYDREQEGLPSLQTLIYKTCSFWNWLWPLPHLQWNSALHCMGFLISPRCSLCSLIGHVLFFCWDIKVCTVTLAHSWAHDAYTDTCTYTQTLMRADKLDITHPVLRHEVVKSQTSSFAEGAASYFNLPQSSSVIKRTKYTVLHTHIHIHMAT